jgi:hypothetical protein
VNGATAAGETLPPPDAIRRTAEEILARSYFDLDTGEIDLTFLRRIAAWFEELLAPFNTFFQGLYATSPVLALLLIAGLFVIVVLLVWHIAYTFKLALRRRDGSGPVDLSEDAPDDPAAWEREAAAAAGRGEYVTALRALLRAALLRLEAAAERRLRPAVTNREYLRRFRATPAHEPLAALVGLVDAKWYGSSPCTGEDYREGENAHRQLLAFLDTRRHAANA